MNDKKAVFIDIDGTLLDSDGVNPKNCRSMEKLRSLGHYVFINTGRSLSWIPPKSLDGITYDGLITGMGSRIEISGEVIREMLIENRVADEILKHFWDDPEVCCFISGTKNGYIHNPLLFFKDFELIPIASPNDFSTAYKDEKIQKIEFVTNGLSKEDMDFIKERVSVWIHGLFLECAAKGSGKAEAMLYAADSLGISRKNIYAIGDSINDLDMLQNAGHSVAMFNSSRKIKGIADYISTSCRNGGVSYAIEKFILNT